MAARCLAEGITIAVIDPRQPTINVSVPVPTPVATAKPQPRPKPVQPNPPAAPPMFQPVPPGLAEATRPQPVARAFILPWSMGQVPRRRLRRVGPKRYSLSTEKALHAAIFDAQYHRDRPYEKMPGLAYSDFLEENGKPAHAEMVRRNSEEYEDNGAVGLGGSAWHKEDPQGTSRVWVNHSGGDWWAGVPPTRYLVNLTTKSLHNPSWAFTWGYGKEMEADQAKAMVQRLIAEGALPHGDAINSLLEPHQRQPPDPGHTDEHGRLSRRKVRVVYPRSPA